MKILYRRSAALDVHKGIVCACIRRVCGKSEIELERATFRTFTADVERLGEWLLQHKVKRVAMESTGVYWIPVWNILEAKRFRLQLLLVNPILVKALPGQKTDPKDAARIAELHQYGLLRGSFVPPPPIRQLRDLVRRRTQLQNDRNRIINRIERLMETVNLKVGSVTSKTAGASVRRMLWAIVDGESDPVRLAGLALGSLKKKQAELVQALNGRFSVHFRSMAADLLEDLRHIEQKVERIERQIGTQMEPHADIIRRLDTIPGVDAVTAWTIVAEIGVDMSVFPSANHLASWAGLCPGSNESAGKRKSGRTRKGNKYLRRGLVQSAWAIERSEDNYLKSLFYRCARRRGMKKAAVMVAHRLLMIAYYIIRDGVEYKELGADHQDRLHPLRTTRRLVNRLSNLGFEVELRPRQEIAQPVLPDPVVEADPSAPRKRGRPKGSRNQRPYVRHQSIDAQPSCRKCTERGIQCYHRSSPPKPTVQPNVRCPKCAAWGIECIHAKYYFGNPDKDSTSI